MTYDRDYKVTLNECIKTIGDTSSLKELNLAYNSAIICYENILSINKSDAEDSDLFYKNLALTANMNIVRIAQVLYSSFQPKTKEAKIEMIKTIELLKNEIKDHHENDVQLSILDNIVSGLTDYYEL